jgi:hypothetical protein
VDQDVDPAELLQRAGAPSALARAIDAAQATLKRCIDRSDTGERTTALPVRARHQDSDESFSCDFPEKFFEEMDHICQVP